MAGKLMVLAVAVVMMVVKGIAAEKLTVGDGAWTATSSPDIYSKWAARHTFVVGDILIFVFTTGNHTVAVVTSQEAYEKCDATLDKKAEIVTQGPFEVSLTSTGPHYYFCTIPGHCNAGQKLAINVTTGSPASEPPSESPPKHDSAPAITISSLSLLFVALVAAALLH